MTAAHRIATKAAQQITDHITACLARPLDLPAAKTILAQRRASN